MTGATVPFVWLSHGALRCLSKQLAEAIDYCHMRQIMHRDLILVILLWGRWGLVCWMIHHGWKGSFFSVSMSQKAYEEKLQLTN